MNNKIDMRGSDFTEPPEPKKQANVLVFGDPGEGKTTFALKHAPDPVAFLSYDRRGDHPARKYHEEGRRILHTRIEYPAGVSTLNDVKARELGHAGISKTMKNVEWAVREAEKGNVRTIAIDTGTEYAEIVTLAFRGRIDKADDFGKSKDLINRQLWTLFNTARDSQAHLIVLARAKSVWEGNKPSGMFTYRGPEVLEDAVDWVGHIRLKKVSAKQRGSEAAKTFELEMTRAKIDISVQGDVYTEDDWGEYGPFVWACTMNYPGTEPSDWR